MKSAFIFILIHFKNFKKFVFLIKKCSIFLCVSLFFFTNIKIRLICRPFMPKDNIDIIPEMFRKNNKGWTVWGYSKKKEENKSNQALTLILLSKQNYSGFFFILNFAYFDVTRSVLSLLTFFNGLCRLKFNKNFF